MRFTSAVWLAVAVCSSIVWGAPSHERRVVSPSNDPFYVPPNGFHNTAPGTILRQRRVLTGLNESWQLLYRTTAINGSAIATVTTIFKPLFGARKDRYISFQTAYDSSATICNPSYNYQIGSVPTDLISQAEQLILDVYLSQGYIVASSDYEGPDAAFGAGPLAGTGVLDNMRAVSNFAGTLGLDSNPMVVAVGYSGGAIATGWAASLQQTYAPELNIKGFVAGGTPANLTGTLQYLDGTLFAGFLPAAFAGLITPSAYGASLAPVVDSIVTPKGESVLSFASKNCAVPDLLNFSYQSVLSTQIQTLGTGLLTQPIVAAILAQLTMGTTPQQTPRAPVLFYHATNDEIIPYGDAAALASRWCADGASVQFVTFANGGHLTTEIVGLPTAIAFVEAAFAGTTAAGCTSSTQLADTLNPLAFGVSLEPTLISLLGVLVALGKGDANVRKNGLGLLGTTV